MTLKHFPHGNLNRGLTCARQVTQLASTELLWQQHFLRVDTFGGQGKKFNQIYDWCFAIVAFHTKLSSALWLFRDFLTYSYSFWIVLYCIIELVGTLPYKEIYDNKVPTGRKQFKERQYSNETKIRAKKDDMHDIARHHHHRPHPRSRQNKNIIKIKLLLSPPFFFLICDSKNKV